MRIKETLEKITIDGKCDKKNKLNRSDKQVPTMLIDEIETGEITVESLETCGLPMKRNIPIEDVTFEIICHPEETQIEGNAMASGNEDHDRKVEQDIQDQLESGNEWAWCTVQVRASYDEQSASEYLGCCSYESEEDFKKGGYYEDMKETALAALILTLVEDLTTATPKINLTSYNGDNHVVEVDKGEYFVSYGQTLAFRTKYGLCLDQNLWDKSQNIYTSRYRNKFTGMDTRQTKAAIKKGEILLLNLN